MNVAVLCGSLADFLICRTLRLGSYPTRKAMERDTGMGKGWAAIRVPMGWIKLPQVMMTSRESHQSQSVAPCPCWSWPLQLSPLEAGMAPHPDTSWEAPLTFHAV